VNVPVRKCTPERLLVQLSLWNLSSGVIGRLVIGGNALTGTVPASVGQLQGLGTII
jgi:hypothetical protein